MSPVSTSGASRSGDRVWYHGQAELPGRCVGDTTPEDIITTPCARATRDLNPCHRLLQSRACSLVLSGAIPGINQWDVCPNGKRTCFVPVSCSTYLRRPTASPYHMDRLPYHLRNSLSMFRRLTTSRRGYPHCSEAGTIGSTPRPHDNDPSASALQLPTSLLDTLRRSSCS